MEDAFHLGGELVFTVCGDAPLRMTHAQARQKLHILVANWIFLITTFRFSNSIYYYYLRKFC